jgi:tRNA-dihydrouridine synthase
MGRDNSPRERQRRDLERGRQRGRALYERILIVSEGSKTEPFYLDEIRVTQRLPVRNITVTGGELGTDPVQVVQYAKNLFEKGDPHKGIEPRAFDRVFAVFDRDQHRGYDNALGQAEALDGKLKNDEKRRVPFQAIVSIPCFELWLLLHYEDVHAPLSRNEALRRLKQHIPCYDKGMKNAYATTRNRLDAALRRAEALAERGFNAHTAPEPFTDVAALVKLLTTLRG